LAVKDFPIINRGNLQAMVVILSATFRVFMGGN